MKDERRFALFVSAGYQPVRPIPSSAEICANDPVSSPTANVHSSRFRNRLPDLDSVTYTFPKTSTGECVQNFYHMGDFMIVSEQLKDALSGRFGPELEVSPVRIQHEDGSPPWQPYFATRVKTVIDCIDPDRSIWMSSAGPRLDRKFADGLSVSVLDEECRKAFSNGGGGKYISYPSMGSATIRKLQLMAERIPPHAVLFQPMYWPGHWIIEAAFAYKLGRACAGGTYGEYFWTLDLGDVEASHYKHLFESR